MGRIYNIDSSIAANAKIAVVMRRIEVLETPSAPQVDQANQLHVPTCFNYRTQNHVMEDCPVLMNPMNLILE